MLTKKKKVQIASSARSAATSTLQCVTTSIFAEHVPGARVGPVGAPMVPSDAKGAHLTATIGKSDKTNTCVRYVPCKEAIQPCCGLRPAAKRARLSPAPPPLMVLSLRRRGATPNLGIGACGTQHAPVKNHCYLNTFWHTPVPYDFAKSNG